MMRALLIGLLLTCATPAVAQLQPGEWTATEEASDGNTNVDLHYETAPITQELLPENQHGGVNFFIGCLEKKIAVGVVMDEAAVTTDIPVTIAVDLQPSERQIWDARRWQGTAVALYEESRARKLIDSLLHADRITLQMSPHGRIATYSYQLKDMRTMIGAIEDRCSETD